jgi:predicted RNase H-like nuclease (RuvC/YqgF family)
MNINEDKDLEYQIMRYKEECAELEKENAELKTKKIPQLERRIASIRGSHSVDAKKLNARIEQVERLKKENTELKEQIETLEQIKREHTDYTIKVEEERTFVKEQLTKAKEIIREFVEWANWQGNSKCPSFKSIQDKAEQFLNSEVENDSKALQS